jgi:hypothetical protein
MEINDYSLRLTGSASIPEPLELGEDITLGLTINIYKVEDSNNENGTLSRVFKAKPTGDILITKKWGKTIKAKLKNSPQAKFHWACKQYHNEKNIEEPFDSWYPKFIDTKIAEMINDSF